MEVIESIDRQEKGVDQLKRGNEAYMKQLSCLNKVEINFNQLREKKNQQHDVLLTHPNINGTMKMTEFNMTLS